MQETGSIHGPGRSHMTWGNKAPGPQLLSLHGKAQEPQLQKPACPSAHALQQEKPPYWEACAPQQWGSPVHDN